jgi:hypothetical protein
MELYCHFPIHLLGQFYLFCFIFINYSQRLNLVHVYTASILSCCEIYTYMWIKHRVVIVVTVVLDTVHHIKLKRNPQHFRGRSSI